MSRWRLIIGIGCMVGCTACGGGGLGFGGGSGKALVTVNGKAITEGDIDFLGTINPRLKSQAGTPFGQKQIVDNLLEQELLYQESARRGLDKDPKVRAKADLYSRVIIAQAVLDDELEKAAQKHYNEHKDEFEKVEMSHLLIRFKGAGTDAEKKGAKDGATRSEPQALQLANQLKERLDKGEEFAKLAKEYSEDPGSKNAGGLLGKVWKQEPRLERRGYGPLLEKAFSMKVGEVAGPIKTQEGYHLMALTKGVEAQSFDDAKQSIFFKLQGDLRTKFLVDLKQKAKIEYAKGTEEAPKPQTPPAGEKPEGTAPPNAPSPAGPTPAPGSPEAPSPAPQP
ncbi:MAG: peptidylprolyl isomerase [Deltaproteobacteria bacterium]|nr:peptidylprolyl isomerase [Deltaproteobacteria bacterium]